MLWRELVQKYGLLALVVLCIVVIGSFKWYSHNKWEPPYYEVEEEKVLLSDKVDELSDTQKEVFYRYIYATIKNELDIDLNKYSDDSLYLEKTAINHEYYVEYTCHPNDKITTYKTTLILKPESSLKSDQFSYSNFDSELVLAENEH